MPAKKTRKKAVAAKVAKKIAKTNTSKASKKTVAAKSDEALLPISDRRQEIRRTADLRDKEIQLRHDRHRSDNALSPVVIVYHKGQRIGPARLLDAVANGLLRRKEQP